MGTAGAGWKARVAAVLLIVPLVGFAAASRDAWPFGAWQLFSRVRGPDQTSYAANAVYGYGERRIDFGALPRSFHGAHAVLGDFLTLGQEERTRVCNAWAAALARGGDRPDAVRIYRVVTTTHPDGRPPTVENHLVHECAYRRS